MNQPNQNGQPMPRNQLLTLLDTGLEVKAYNFVRLAATKWLETYPGDLQISLFLGKALALDGNYQRALPIVETLCQKDPEFFAAQELLLFIYSNLGESGEKQSITEGNIFALGGIPVSGIRNETSIALPDWSQSLLMTRQSLNKGEISAAEDIIQNALSADNVTPLVGLTHLLLLSHQAESQPSSRISPFHTLSDFYHKRWPECLPISLLYAESMMDGGESDRGVVLFHQIVAQDISGQVVDRLWGENHRYKNLWPQWLALDMDLQIPAAIAAFLGWNLLPNVDKDINITIQDEEKFVNISSKGVQNIPYEPKDRQVFIKMPHPAGTLKQQTSEELPTQPPHKETQTSPVSTPPQTNMQSQGSYPAYEPETLLSTQEELDKIALRLKQPQLVRTEGRFPVYVVFTTRKGLIAHYGQAGFETLDNALKQLVTAIKINRNWGARLLYADDQRSASAVGIKPVSSLAPWTLKLALADLDNTLAKSGEMVGAVLIIGGPEVVPFHNLPNPIDDSDLDVPSDNPYATRDENYFIPEWPVGRLPGGKGKDPKILLKLIQGISQEHLSQPKPKPWYLWFLEFLFGWLVSRNKSNSNSNFGYTAAVWQQASLSVYKPIGNTNSMLVSPPSQANDYLGRGINPPHLGYFNLHGVPNAPEWFGQADPTHPYSGEDYPIAIRPLDVRNSGHAPQVIYTEACYGAYIIDKDIDQALSLKFITSGTKALVGSTGTSYGSVNDPLIAADLLGNAFWKNMKNGLPAGEALRQAKITLVREMDLRQGYLDGEDQKTLISFLLFGDPLACMDTTYLKPKDVLRSLDTPDVKTIREEIDEDAAETLPTYKLEAVKQAVKQYLPGMIDAQISFSNVHTSGDSARAQIHSPYEQGQQPGEKQLPFQVVTLHKQVSIQSKLHQHFARLIMDEKGNVIKMTVSR